MAKPALLETLRRIAEPVVVSMGLEIWGIEVLQSGRCVVRIYVDTPPGATAKAAEADSVAGAEEMRSPERLSVSIDQCAEISRMVGLALEVEEVFSAAYVLEVSSPGLSRVFFRPDQLPPYVGDEVAVALHEAHPEWPGRRKFRGALASVDGDVLTLRVAVPQAGGEPVQTHVRIFWNDVRRAERIHTFSMPEKPGRRKRATGKQGVLQSGPHKATPEAT
ncbi:MAG: ribosome maturation factor [Desulfovibrionaceae bacterium]|nr:ribosome maturation factor [Desulfovibrionaceae bacterium]